MRIISLISESSQKMQGQKTALLSNPCSGQHHFFVTLVFTESFLTIFFGKIQDNPGITLLYKN